MQNHVLQEQPSGGEIPLNIGRYCIMWVQLALVSCHVPFAIAAVLDVNGIKNDVARLTTETLVYLNPSLNPILDCWKIREGRQAVKDIIRQLNCFKNATCVHRVDHIYQNNVSVTT